MAAGDVIHFSDYTDLTHLVAEVKVTSDSSTMTTETEIASLTVSVVSGATYELRWSAHVSTTTTGTNAIVRVKDTTVGGTELVASQVNCATTTTVGYQVTGMNDWTAAATGSQVFKLTLNTNTGAQPVQLRASASRKCRLQLWRVP